MKILGNIWFRTASCIVAYNIMDDIVDRWWNFMNTNLIGTFIGIMMSVVYGVYCLYMFMLTVDDIRFAIGLKREMDDIRKDIREVFSIMWKP